MTRVYYLIQNCLLGDGVYNWGVQTIGTTSHEFAAFHPYMGLCQLVDNSCLAPFSFHDMAVALISYYAIKVCELYM